MNKIKQLFIKIKNNIKNIPKNNLIIILIFLVVVIAGIILTISIISSTHKLTKLEEIKINEVNDKISNYLEEYLLYPEDEGRYIIFALEYLYNTTDKVEYSSEEVLKVINDTFNVNYSIETLNNIGITSNMLEKAIEYNSASNIYKYESKMTQSDIAKTPIIKYELTNIKKSKKDKYILTYKKYVIEDPHVMLNYYSNQNIEGEDHDLSIIRDYIKGNSKISTIKNWLNTKDIDNFGKIDGSIEIEFIIKDNKLVINNK